VTLRLPTAPAHALTARPRAQQWLINELWADEAVGIIGGEPKCCKSFLALDIAVAVASGAPCLRRFAPARTGRVLLYAAEDALHVVRDRLAGIARAGGRTLADLDIHVITAPSVRLDVDRDRQCLANTLADLKPTLLVLDPFVRLHRIDENNSGEVAPLLAFLRHLQRLHNLAVVLVHHARKGGARMRAGQALRGSSEFHAWGDSNLYLRRHADQLTLSVEHRAAPSPDQLALHLHTDQHALALRIVYHTAIPPTTHTTEKPAPDTRISSALANAGEPLSFSQLRAAAGIRTATCSKTVNSLLQRGAILRTNANHYIPAPPSHSPVPQTSP